MSKAWTKARLVTEAAYRLSGSLRRRRPSVYLERELLSCPRTSNDELTEKDDDPKRLVRLYEEDGLIDISTFLNNLEKSGLRSSTDPRLRNVARRLEELVSERAIENADTLIPFETFWEVIEQEIELVNKALSGNLVIPDFVSFTKQIEICFRKCEVLPGDGNHDNHATVTSRPIMVDSARLDAWGVSICSVDGQRISLGQTREKFALGSCMYPLLLALTEDEVGRDMVYKHVGREPSGVHSEDILLNEEGKPHNSMISMGSIVIASLFRPDLTIPDRFDYLVKRCNDILGEGSLDFDLAWYLKKKERSYKEKSIGHTLRKKKVFPENSPPMDEVLDFYLQMQSLSISTDQGSVIAATLANGGVSPLSKVPCMSSSSVRDTLSTMHSCGLYDYSGRWAFEIGLPAKSSSTGAILIVVPSLMGICVWGPLLDNCGNSKRGILFAKELTRLFALHEYDTVSNMPKSKMNPRGFMICDTEETQLFKLIFAAERGDVYLIRKYIRGGVDPDHADFDGRTALHLACCGGRLSAVHVLVNEFHAFLNPIDLNKHTPLDEAVIGCHDEIRDYLLDRGAERGLQLLKPDSRS